MTAPDADERIVAALDVMGMFPTADGFADPSAWERDVTTRLVATVARLIEDAVAETLDAVLERADDGIEFGPKNTILLHRIVRDVRRAALAETADGPSAARNGAQSDEQAAEAPGGRDEDKRLLEALYAFANWVAIARAYNGSPHQHGQSLYNERLNAVLGQWAREFVTEHPLRPVEETSA